MKIIEKIRNGTGISSVLSNGRDLLDNVRDISEQAATLLEQGRREEAALVLDRVAAS